MDYWQGPSRWINAALLFIVGFVALDAVFTLLGAQDSNLIVGLVGAVAGIFKAPFDGMFPNQPELVTQALAVVGWILLATVLLAVVRGVEQNRRERRAEGAGQELETLRQAGGSAVDVRDADPGPAVQDGRPRQRAAREAAPRDSSGQR